VTGADHHTEYLARAVAALTPEGRRRVDELLDQLAGMVGNRVWLARFARARKAEADAGRADLVPDDGEPARMLSAQELDELLVGFMTIRDTEQLDDVADWANAVVALLEDAASEGSAL
jgi:hypothetical protein